VTVYGMAQPQRGFSCTRTGRRLNLGLWRKLSGTTSHWVINGFSGLDLNAAPKVPQIRRAVVATLGETEDCRRVSDALHCAGMNRLLFGDNLKWLRDRNIFADASVDLVYLDPPFNSNANYNVLFKEASGEASQAQFHAFTDTWDWTADVDATYAEFVDNCPNAGVVELVGALKKFLKTSPMMAHLAMMAPRLVELHRILKPTGSLCSRCTC